MSANTQSGPVAAGWRRLWQAQRVLWWVYAVNLILGMASAHLFAGQVSGVLDHSLAAQRLSHGFDLAYFMELAAHPDVQLGAAASASYLFALLFFAFMLFMTGGILRTYVAEGPLPAGEFFQACGTFLWRFFRLLLWFLLVLVPLGLLASGIDSWSGRLTDSSPRETLGFWVEMGGLGLVLLLLMSARLWFDMAQVRMAITGERGATRAMGRAFKLTFGHFAPLFWMYLRLSVLAWAGAAVALCLWFKFVPPAGTTRAFLLFQFVAWWWILTRLWQRASEVAWYEAQEEAGSGASPDEGVPSLVARSQVADSEYESQVDEGRFEGEGPLFNPPPDVDSGNAPRQE
jgi:hypothetical protein